MTALSAFFESAKLPVMTEVSRALVRTLNDENASAGQIQRIIEKDPALVAQLLRQANSAHFGLSRQVQSLDHAVMLLGMSRVRALALSNSIRTAFPEIPGLSRTEFWRFCMDCATFAQWLARPAQVDPQQAWLVGMMLRLGEMIIAQRAPEMLVEIEAPPHGALERWQREQELLGFDEGQVTAVLAKHWNFPHDIVVGLQKASNPMAERPFDPLGAVIHLAALLADRLSMGPEAIDELPPAVVVALALDPDALVAQFPPPEKFGPVDL